MASAPPDLPIHRFTAPDGIGLAWREMGEGRPLVLIHGLFSSAWTNWIRYGHAARIAAAGVRLIMPDLRGHGASDKPRDPTAWPADILARDGLALVKHLGLVDYDLGGYSLGGRTTARMMALGATPARAIFAGMGLEGMVHTAGRGGFFRKVLEGIGTHPRGSPEWMAEAFLKTTGGDAQALLPLLDTFVDTPRAVLTSFAPPILVLAGVDDQDNGSSEDLAALLPQGRFRAIPGNHMSAVLRPELGVEIAAFLND